MQLFKSLASFVGTLKESTERMKHEAYLKHENHKRKMIIQSKESLVKRGYHVPDDVSTLSNDEVDEFYRVIGKDIDEKIKKLRESSK